MPIFDTWKIRFNDREAFNSSVRFITCGDIGHADMVLTFDKPEEMESTKAVLIGNGITAFSTENP